MTTSAPGALHARVHKLLGSQAELEATKTILQTLVKDVSNSSTSLVQLETSASSGMPTLATLRRNLRSNLETQQLALAQKALVNLEHILEQVLNLTTQVDVLDYKCEQVYKFLETTKTETQQAQTEAAALATTRDTMQEQWKETKAFLDRYQLTEEEVHMLYAEHLVDEEMETFFSTLERVQQIKEDCKELAAIKDVTCGFELLKTAEKHLEAGFERLYRWTNKKCAEVDEDPSSMLHRAITLLNDREEFYNNCKESLTSSRRLLIVRRFIMALTVGGPNGIPRPIELHAHDPVRYCGDMLAWIHQAIATENEFFRVLFNDDVDFSPSAATDLLQTSEASRRNMLDGCLLQIDKPQGHIDGVIEEICTSMVGHAIDGVSRPLQVRVEQTLSSPHGIVTAYKLCCREAANEAFCHQLQQLVDAVAASSQDYTVSLAATHVTLDVSHRLVALLEVFQTSLLAEREKEADLAPVFDGVLSAVELMCQRSVAGLDPAEALIFRINNFSCLHTPLTRFPEATKWCTKMGHDLGRWLQDLSELQASCVMDQCHVAALLQCIQDFQQRHASIAMDSGTSPANAPGLDGETITRAMADFCASLTTLIFPQLDSLAQPALSDKARALSSATLAGTHEPISLSASGERNRRVVLEHTPEEIRTVLEIDGELGEKVRRSFLVVSFAII
ncbi:unnamed protein product [Peronospora belbahrii]|uniref:Conserved oligomeric Golgi complex subunit 6 n=1 Tax=Peronospora belbahrii TaxID=622444 RepID=A0AAU9KQD2_9STRA|nr:unnamed protein product [Peronospora belbahrii]